jgi:hypothetical protein
VVGLKDDLRRDDGTADGRRSVAEIAALDVLAVQRLEIGRAHASNRTGSLERS